MVPPPAVRPTIPSAPPMTPAPPAAPPVQAAPVAAPTPPAAPAFQIPVAPASPPVAAPPPGRPAGRPVNPFLTQDPSQKARRLARALISDLAVYYPDRRKEGLANGTLKELFQEEIQKSWEEYTDQVGKEMADATSYFNDALNEILAGGQRIF